MIIDRLKNISSYTGLGENFGTAARWLEQADLGALAAGTVEIDGERVFATLAENRLSDGEPAFEAHRRYADIQVILDGKERFLLGTEAEILSPEPGTDFYPCRAAKSMEAVLEPGQFVIFLPGEAHSPGNAAGEQKLCRKLVVKVLAENGQGGSHV